jgi:peptidoglycan/xylan/chitin deacetylase (PgdA/CDA1 family)
LLSIDCKSSVQIFLAAVLSLASPGGQAVTRVIITIDVESQALTLPEQVEAVCGDSSRCGLMEIARLLKERGIAGTFFLNVYEYSRWGEAAMRDIAVKLQATGQDVALHTHPETTYDPSRTEMYQYSLDEQTLIIRDGVERLREWTGHPVVAHRAGDYSADDRTLEALKRNGIQADSSLFWGHPSSRLNALGLTRNLPSTLGGLIEIPVTVYQRREEPWLFGAFDSVNSVRKIDVDWLLDEDEARAAIDSVINAELPFVVIFLHSFSLLKKHQDDRLVLDQHSLNIFRAILDRVTDKGLPVVTMGDVVKMLPIGATLSHHDVVPQVVVRARLDHYIWHRLKQTAAGSLTVGVSGLLMLLLLVGCATLITRHRRTPTVVTRENLPPGS